MLQNGSKELIEATRYCYLDKKTLCRQLEVKKHGTKTVNQPFIKPSEYILFRNKNFRSCHLHFYRSNGGSFAFIIFYTSFRSLSNSPKETTLFVRKVEIFFAPFDFLFITRFQSGKINFFYGTRQRMSTGHVRSKFEPIRVNNRKW